MILITGANGFIGSNLVKYFDINDIDYITDDKIKASKEKYHYDYDWNPILSQVTTIIHLAGKAHDLKKTANSDEYYKINTDLTKNIFDSFLISDAKIFITLSSVKAIADSVDELLTEKHVPDPKTHYGKSKLLAEKYILSQQIPLGKRVYILRPCMIHGPGNKGNLNLLYKLVSKGVFWPLGSFNNKRSFCSIDNLLFVIKELIEREDISSGVYNVSDDDAISTNEIIKLIAQSQNKKTRILNVSKKIIIIISKLGDKLNLPLNSERLHKLTESYLVSNLKIKDAIGKPFPIKCKQGLLKTFKAFR